MYMHSILRPATIVVIASQFTLFSNAAAPLLSDIPDQIISVGTDASELFFVVGDTETSFADLSLSVTTSNPSLVPLTGLVFDSLQGGGRSITVTPTANTTGTSTITVTVTADANESTSDSFQYTVTEANTPPTLQDLPAYQIVRPGETPAPLPFRIGDAETDPASLALEVRSSYEALVPSSNLTLSGTGDSRSLSITPTPGQRGATVIRIKLTDALGMATDQKLIFSVYDPSSSNAAIEQPYGLYLLDSSAGTKINGVSMRDRNVTDASHIDGYVLRTSWNTLEPNDGLYDFTIIDNIFSVLPPSQKLSLIIGLGGNPNWFNGLAGVETYSSGSPSTESPIPWNETVQSRLRTLLETLAAHTIDEVPLGQHPRLTALNVSIPGLKSGIRNPSGIQIKDIPGYSRSNLEKAVLTHLENVTSSFPGKPVQIGFWTYRDDVSNPPPWEDLRAAILQQHDGATAPRIGFWMENLAANRPSYAANPFTGLPITSYAAALYGAQDEVFTGYQKLGSWSQPFNSAHVDNNLNGTPEDSFVYAFSDYQCRYFEIYSADVAFDAYTEEYSRWKEFLHAINQIETTEASETEIRARIEVVSNQAKISWNSVPGQSYSVQATPDLADWTNASTEIVAASIETTWEEAISEGKFYRVAEGFESGNDDEPEFEVTYSGTTFTYTDSERSFSGILVLPEGDGPFPAIVINHGTGGSANGFSLRRANEMSPWGAACIGPTLTHEAGADLVEEEIGFSPENLERVKACIRVLESRDDIDTTRLALWGHSRGAFNSIGCASALGDKVKALGFSAGGINGQDDASLSLPSQAEAQGIVAPTLMFHGDSEQIVDPNDSALLKTLLDSNGIVNERILYPTNQHNLHQIAETYADILDRWQAWLVTHKVLP